MAHRGVSRCRTLAQIAEAHAGVGVAQLGRAEYRRYTNFGSENFSTKSVVRRSQSGAASSSDFNVDNAAQTLVRLLEGAGEQRTEYWHNRIVPYLRHIWPKSREVVTPAISESFARLCIAADNAFPDAVGALRHWLQPLRYPEFIVGLLDEAKLCERFPNEATAFLDRVLE